MYNKIAILMSTYNGERFIREQIDSIIKQSCKEWSLYIRDDGSTDNTINIVNEYVHNNENIYLLTDNKNMGVVRSFFYLMNNVDSKYYMFCDQDDYWVENKVEDTLSTLELNEEFPTLVYSKKSIVDENLIKIENVSSLRSNNLDFSLFCMDNFISGCTMGINRKLRDLVIRVSNYENILMHDWWISMVASYFGKIIFIDKFGILYRQHGDNAVGVGTNRVTLKKIFNRLFNNRGSFSTHIMDVMNQLKLFEHTYGEYIKKDSNRHNNRILVFLLHDYKRFGRIKRIFILKKYKIRMLTFRHTVQMYCWFFNN